MIAEVGVGGRCPTNEAETNRRDRWACEARFERHGSTSVKVEAAQWCLSAVRGRRCPRAADREQSTTAGLYPTGICEISARTSTVVSCCRRWAMRYPRSALVAVLALILVPAAWGQPQAELVLHRYSTTLRSRTQGPARYGAALSHYEEVQSNICETLAPLPLSHWQHPARQTLRRWSSELS